MQHFRELERGLLCSAVLCLLCSVQYAVFYVQSPPSQYYMAIIHAGQDDDDLETEQLPIVSGRTTTAPPTGAKLPAPVAAAKPTATSTPVKVPVSSIAAKPPIAKPLTRPPPVKEFEVDYDDDLETDAVF